MLQSVIRALENTKQWGWLLYRTVYTPGSDQRCELALGRLREYMISDLHRNISDDATAEQGSELSAKFNLAILQDPIFQHATLDGLRTNFKQWALQQEHFDTARFNDPRWQVFFILDDKGLNTILDSPMEKPSDWRAFTLTAVQANYPGNSWWITDEEKAEEEAQEAEEEFSEEEEDRYDEIAAGEESRNRWPGQVNVAIYFLYCFWQYLSPEEMNLEKYAIC